MVRLCVRGRSFQWPILKTSFYWDTWPHPLFILRLSSLGAEPRSSNRDCPDHDVENIYHLLGDTGHHCWEQRVQLSGTQKAKAVFMLFL